MTKINYQTRNRRELLSFLKGIYENPTGNILLNAERLNTLPLRLGIRQGWALYHSYEELYWRS